MAAPFKKLFFQNNWYSLQTLCHASSKQQHLYNKLENAVWLQVCYASASVKPHEYTLPRPPKAPSIYGRDPHSKMSNREGQISQAMKSYLEKRNKHEAFMAEEVAQYEIGKRHLANIMGEDPNTFTQRQIDAAIAYLMPSGLFDPYARPQLKHPIDILPVSKVAQFAENGQPFDHLFYTGKPRFYNMMFAAGEMLDKLKEMESKATDENPPQAKDRMSTLGDWFLHVKIRHMCHERVTEADYQKMLNLFSRLLYHPYSIHAKPLISQVRKVIESVEVVDKRTPVHIDKNNRHFHIGEGKRKRAMARVYVYRGGSGKVTINGESFCEYLPALYDREQIAFPLLFTDLMPKVDITAMVNGGGRTSQTGALRLALSKALFNFVSVEEGEKMRLAGLLSADPRQKERKKPGKHSARKSFTWKRR